MAFFNGQIAQIDESIMRDIDVLVEHVQSYENKEDLRLIDCAARVERYLTDYRKAELEAEKLEDVKNDSV